MASSVLFANNAASVLQYGITASATSVLLAPGTGSLFPQPSGSEFFALTFCDVLTQTVREVVYVTEMQGDTIAAMIRGQENTSALTWPAGSLAQALITAGGLSLLGAGGEPFIEAFPVPIAGTVTFPFAEAGDAVYQGILTASTAFAFSGGDNTISQQITVIVQQGSTGGFSVTFPNDIIWAGGFAPSIPTAANSTFVFYITTSATTGVYLGSASSSTFEGGTLTEPLILEGDPIVPLGAATKEYVDILPTRTVATPYVIQLTDANTRLLVNTAGGGFVTLPAGLPANFNVLLTQIASPQMVIATTGGVTVQSYLNNLAAAGEFATLSLTYVATNVYQLDGNIGAPIATSPPVLNPLAATVGSDIPIGAAVASIQPTGTTDGSVYTIISGNTAGYFSLNSSAGALTIAQSVQNVSGTQTLGLQGFNVIGTTTETGTVNIIPAFYSAPGAVARFQPRNPNFAGLVDTNGDGILDAFGNLSDLEGTPAAFVGNSNTTTHPLPTIGQANGLVGANFSAATSEMVGNSAAEEIPNGVGYFAVEGLISVASLASINAIIKASTVGVGTRFGLQIATSGKLQVFYARLDSDATQTITSSAASLPNGVNDYLYAAWDYAHGKVTMRINELEEIIYVVSQSGYGNCSATGLTALLLGAATGSTTMQFEEMSFYTADQGSGQRATNLGQLRTTYAVPAYSDGATAIPVLPTTVTSLSIGLDAPINSIIGTFFATNPTPAGNAIYSITSGNGSGDFGINNYAANVVMVALPAAGAYPLGIGASNSVGTATPITCTFTFIAANYNPIADGAWAWIQSRNQSAVVNGLVTTITDKGPHGANFAQATTANQPAFNSKSVNNLASAVWTGGEVLTGNAAALTVYESIGYFAIEGCVELASLTAGNCIIQLLSGASSMLYIGANITTGKITLGVRRLAADTIVTETTATAALTAGTPHYLYVGVNFLTGAIIIQVDGTIETFTAVWTGGYGVTAASALSAINLGAFNVTGFTSTTMIAPDLAPYQVDPGPTLRAAHRADFQTTYGTP